MTFASPFIANNRAVRYAVAILATAMTLLLRWALNPILGDYIPYVLLWPAVAFSAWYCGIGPSLVSVVLALVGAQYCIIPPLYSLQILNRAQAVGMLAFLCVSAVIIAMGESHRRALDELQKSHDELESRVKERTGELEGMRGSLRKLTGHLLQLRDNEQRKLARELHDSVGQTLAALSMNLSAVRADMERLTATAANLTDSEGLVQEMSKEVRTISHLLHPPLLDEAGLASAVRWYVDGFSQRSKIKVDLDLPDDFGRLPRELETAIFRVVQECLTNIHRHSGSSTARIVLRHFEDHVSVEVADKGKGIPHEKRDEMASAGTPGVGLRGMRERIRQLGGSLEINSDGVGTVVVARLPVAQAPSTADMFLVPDSSPTAAA